MLQRSQVHHCLYVVLTSLLCVSIPLSNVGMSVSMLLLALNWLIEGHWIAKWERLKQRQSALLFAGFMLVCCIGFIHSTDLPRALKDYLHYFPLFFAPLIAASSDPMSEKEIKIVKFAFVESVFFATIASVSYYISHEINDIREISVFISHIRFSLCIDVAILLILDMLFRTKGISLATKWCLVGVLVWLFVYIFIAQTLTGIVLLFVVAVVFCFYSLFRKKERRLVRDIAIGCLALLAVVFVYMSVITYQYFHIEEEELEHLAITTENGNPYSHDSQSMVENGSQVGMYVCREELQSAWAQRSLVEYGAEDLEMTLIRYLNSCHLAKDSAGVMALSDDDIKNVERRVANVAYTQTFGLKRALYPVFFSFQLYAEKGIVNESSLLQRVECWKASWRQIKCHPLLGVGIANHKVMIDCQLEADNSPIKEKKGMGAHNQFLTFWLQGGVFVLVYFLIALLYPFFEKGRKIGFVYIAFFIILFLSMFTEDTLQTEAGITLFAIMNSLFLYVFAVASLREPRIEMPKCRDATM